MDFNDIARSRLANQRIVSTDFKTAENVVSWMGAMQAQDYSGALWAIALRTPSLTLKDVEAAIEKGKIIRTWPMRGTLHFVAARDARWIVQLLGPRASAKAATRRKGLGITEKTIEESKTILSRLLANKTYRSRPDILASFESAGITTGGQRGIHILHYLAEEAYICFGPYIDKQPSFVLFDDWAPSTPDVSKDDALAMLAIRYFQSHGPATERDFTAWSGLTLTDVRRGIELAGSSLTTFEIDRTRYWLDVTQPTSYTADTTFLLPGFDEYMLGYRDRRAALAIEHSDRIVPGGNGVFLPTIVMDGQVVGTWKKTVRRQTVELLVTPFIPLTDVQQAAVRSAALRYQEFLQMPVQVTFS